MKHGKIGIGKLRRAVAEVREQRTSFGFETIEAPVGKAGDIPHGAIILPHQVLRRNAAAQGRYFILTLEAEFVIVASAKVVEKAANLEQYGHAAGNVPV